MRGVCGQGLADLRFRRHEKADGDAAGLGIAPPYYTTEFDFRLKPSAEQGATILDAQQHLAALGAAG
jgi:hypothetical protein